jgi:hypothetical protein
MKSYRQTLSKWVNERIVGENNSEIVNVLNEVKEQIKLMEKYEENMVNRSYESGYIDSIKKIGRVSNYYRKTYKTHDILKKLIK